MPTLKFGTKNIPIKICLLGDGAVGKTSLVKAFVQKGFQKDYLMTVGVDITMKDIVVDNKHFKLSIHDIAGQERFTDFRSIFFSAANMAFCVFDVTRRQSLDSLADIWLEQLLPTIMDKNFTIFLIANKVDLEEIREIKSSECELTYRRLQRKYKMLNWAGFIETSALNNHNVNEAFTEITKAYVEKSGLNLERPKKATIRKKIIEGGNSS
jgi:small GTP-binding protein